MVAVKAHEADRALADLDPAWRLVLIYGPDAGLVGERARNLARRSVDDPDDGFQLVRLDGDALAADPLRLVDEANTIGLFGGRRAIRVSPTTKPLLNGVEPLLATPSRDALVIVEAGDLQKSNPLRLACERSRNALAVPCYGDGNRDLGGIVDEMLRGAGKSIGREARDTLIGLIGGDRQGSRREIEKLILYSGAESVIEQADVEAVIGDTAQREQSGLIDAAFAGQFPTLDLALGRLMAEGTDPGVLLGAVLRHALALLKARLQIDGGRPPREAVAAMRLPFPRMAAAEASLKNWTPARLEEVITNLGPAMLSIRRDAELARPLAARSLWSIARIARTR